MPNILICDDERDILGALKIYLSDPDYTLFEACNGQQAVEIVEREGWFYAVKPGSSFCWMS